MPRRSFWLSVNSSLRPTVSTTHRSFAFSYSFAAALRRSVSGQFLHSDPRVTEYFNLGKKNLERPSHNPQCRPGTQSPSCLGLNGETKGKESSWTFWLLMRMFVQDALEGVMLAIRLSFLSQQGTETKRSRKPFRSICCPAVSLVFPSWRFFITLYIFGSSYAVVGLSDYRFVGGFQLPSLTLLGFVICNAHSLSPFLRLPPTPLPIGLVNPNCVGLIGNGVVVHLPSFFKELDELQSQGLDCANRLFISDRAQLVFDFHQIVDGLKEVELGRSRYGSVVGFFFSSCGEELIWAVFFWVALELRRGVLVLRTLERPPGLDFEFITSLITKPLRKNSASWSMDDTNDMGILSTILKGRYSDTRLVSHIPCCPLSSQTDEILSQSRNWRRG